MKGNDILIGNLEGLEKSGFFDIIKDSKNQLSDLFLDPKNNKTNICKFILKELKIEITENSLKNLKYIISNIKNINEFILKKITDLLNHGVPENLKSFFGKKGIIKTKEDLEELMKNDKWNDIYYLIKNGEPEKLKLIFGEKGIIKTKEDLEKLMENSKWYDIIKLINKSNSKNMKLIFGEKGIIKTKEDLEKLMENSKWYDIIRLNQESKIQNMKLFFNNNFFSVKNLTELEGVMDSPKWDDLKYWLVYGTCGLKPILKGLSYSNFNNDEELVKQNLFNKNVYQFHYNETNTLDYLLELMKQNPEKDIYELIKTDIDAKLSEYTKDLKKHTPEEIKKNFDKLKLILDKKAEGEKELIKKLKINVDQLELAIYLRHGHTVDYPEIGEYVSLFLYKYVKECFVAALGLHFF